MSTLHLINSEGGLNACLEVATTEDSLLLLGEAAPLAGNDAGRRLFVLADDLQHGITPAAANVKVGYPEFVDLVVSHQPIVTWR